MRPKYWRVEASWPGSPPNPSPAFHRLKKYVEQTVSMKHKYPNFSNNVEGWLWQVQTLKATENPNDLSLTLSHSCRAQCLWHRACKCSIFKSIIDMRWNINIQVHLQYLCSPSGIQTGSGPQFPCHACALLYMYCTATYCSSYRDCEQVSSPYTWNSSKNKKCSYNTRITNQPVETDWVRLVSFLFCFLRSVWFERF